MTNDEFIIKFLDKSLTSEEKSLFDKKMTTEPDFVKEVKAALQVIALLRTQKDTEIAEEWEKESEESEQKKKIYNLPFYKKRLFWVAASLILAVFMPIMVYQLQRDKKDYVAIAQTTFLDYEKIDRDNKVVKEYRYNISDNEELKKFQNQTQKGDSLMQIPNIGEAIKLYQELLISSPNYESVHFYLGNCYFQLQKYPASLQEWDYLLENSASTEMKDIARWNKILCLFAMNKDKEGRVLIVRFLTEFPDNDRMRVLNKKFNE